MSSTLMRNNKCFVHNKIFKKNIDINTNRLLLFPYNSWITSNESNYFISIQKSCLAFFKFQTKTYTSYILNTLLTIRLLCKWKMRLIHTVKQCIVSLLWKLHFIWEIKYIVNECCNTSSFSYTLKNCSCRERWMFNI